jgi:hypothetical protein
MTPAGSEHWERTKPFAPPGQDMLPQGLPLILDFAFAVTFLELKRGERVLDLGARFDEALARDLVRLLRGAMEDHPVSVATK